MRVSVTGDRGHRERHRPRTAGRGWTGASSGCLARRSRGSGRSFIMASGTGLAPGRHPAGQDAPVPGAAAEIAADLV